DIGDVDAASHHVGEPSTRAAHAPLGDRHDGLDLLRDVADAAQSTLTIDGRRARQQHLVADSHGTRIVRELLQRSSGRHVDAAIRTHRLLLQLRRVTIGGTCGAQGWAASNAAAARSTAASPRLLPTICRPTGSPPFVNPHGIEMAGSPRTEKA